MPKERVHLEGNNQEYPDRKKEKMKLGVAFSNLDPFCSDERGHAELAQDYVPSQIYTVTERITKKWFFCCCWVQAYFEVHQTLLVSEVFSDNSKMKNIISEL